MTQVVQERSSSDQARILLVEEQRHFTNLYRRILSEAGYDVAIASSGEQAIQQLSGDRFDVVLADSQLPDMGGDQLVKTIRLLRGDVRTMFVSTYPDIALRARHCGADAYYAKIEPFTTLLAIIQALVSGSQKGTPLIGDN
jgi:DNA-binding response OmpR family regulator